MVTAKPWLWLSPQKAHSLTPAALKVAGPLLSMLPDSGPQKWSPLEWRGLHFPNRLGLAGGVDKNAENLAAWWKLGAGFLEVGTITPRPQPGNAGTVVDRDVQALALWNKLGFPSRGMVKAKDFLRALPRPWPTPVFANIGKNATTPLEVASKDYLMLLHELQDVVDGFVINISSPNTSGLRKLLEPENLREFLAPLMAHPGAIARPTLLKISPDLSETDLATALTIACDLGVQGFVLTNTTSGGRDGLKFPQNEGGVSGQPLAAKSKYFLQRSLELLGSRRAGKLIVSVGGIMSADDVSERLQMGADLVQVYSALIFEGPFFFRKVAKCQLAKVRG
jgi:dihydroorotate dehydrogenase